MLEVVQAFDRAPIAQLDSDDAAALDRKIEAARRLFADRHAWLKPHQRIEILRRLAALMESKREHLGRQIAREGGKPLTDALVETDRAIDGVRNAVDELRVMAGREIPMGLTPASVDRRAFTILEPIGVVAAISAFNHPLNLIVHQVAPAVATGCPVIVKPASPTPLSCLDFVGLLHEAGLPPDWCQVFLPETSDLAEALATDPRVAFLSFIGSARVGWHLRSKLPPGTRCALEHGGVAPVIVDRSADLDRVIEPLTKGGYYHAGQVCVSVQRIYVHADLEREFLDRFAARVKALRVGDPLLPETEVGPLIFPREADRVLAWTEEAVSAGRQAHRRRTHQQLDADSIDHRQPAPRRQSLDPRSVRPDNLRLSFHAARRCGPCRKFFTRGVSGQHLHRRSADRVRCGRASRRLGGDGQRPYGLPHRLDALRRPPRVGLRHRRHSLDDAGNDRSRR